MNIEPFQPRAQYWLLVIGLRSVDQNDVSRQPSCIGYDAHWTMNNTWSSTDVAMKFTDRENAEEYLRRNREWMERAVNED